MIFSTNTNEHTNLKIKRVVTLVLSGIVNFILGIFSVIGLAMSYSFFTENEKGIDYTDWGIWSLVIVFCMILVPNIIMYLKSSRSKKFVLFQFFTLFFGAVVYIAIKLL